MNKTADPQFTIGQRVRYKNSRDIGRVTGTWQHPGDKFYPAQPGVMVTMDNQYSPPPVPVRFQTFGADFEPLPEDYLDDGEALEQIATTLGSATSANEALTEIISVMRRNDRITGDPRS